MSALLTVTDTHSSRHCRGQFGADMLYLRSALRGVMRRYNINSKQIAIAGFSDGATVALSLLPLGGIASHIIAWSPGGFAPPMVVRIHQQLVSLQQQQQQH